MKQKEGKYIPALSYGWLTKFFDPVIRWTMPEAAFKSHLVKQAQIKDTARVLDLGCGTATLSLLVKQAHPKAEVVGLDGDPKVLELAKAKVLKEGVQISLDYGMAFEMPYPDQTFDRVLSSLVFHHLTLEDKARTLKEVLRVLRPGGELHIADFGKPHNSLMYLLSLILRNFEEAGDNFKGVLPDLMREAGYKDVAEKARYATIFSTVSLYSARKPEI